MKKELLITILCLGALTGLTSCSETAPVASDKVPAAGDKASAAGDKASANKEEAFVTSFRQALENNDANTLDSFLLKEGTPADIVEFFTMMMEVSPGMKVESVELVSPSAEEATKFQQAMEMPDGKSYELPIVPTKQLMVIMKEESPGGRGTSKSSFPVAEKDGKFVIPLPVPAE